MPTDMHANSSLQQIEVHVVICNIGTICRTHLVYMSNTLLLRSFEAKLWYFPYFHCWLCTTHIVNAVVFLPSGATLDAESSKMKTDIQRDVPMVILQHPALAMIRLDWQ